jgi:hypothetical protein
VNPFGWVCLDFQFAGGNPLDEFADAILDVGGILRFSKFVMDGFRNRRTRLRGIPKPTPAASLPE